MKRNTKAIRMYKSIYSYAKSLVHYLTPFHCGLQIRTQCLITVAWKRCLKKSYAPKCASFVSMKYSLYFMNIYWFLPFSANGFINIKKNYWCPDTIVPFLHTPSCFWIIPYQCVNRRTNYGENLSLSYSLLGIIEMQVITLMPHPLRGR